MNRDFFGEMYNDFFGIEKLKKENEKLAKELNIDSENIPTIDVENVEKASQKQVLSTEDLKKLKDEHMADFFEKLDNLYITDESKSTLKKMIEYMRKYSEKIEKEYIPFNLCIFSEDKEVCIGIVDIISDAATFFEYIKNGQTVESSFYNIEKVSEINEIYSSKNSVIVLNDWDAFGNKDTNFKEAFIHNLEEKIVDNSFLSIITATDKEQIESVYDNYRKNFQFEIVEQKPDAQDVYNEVIERLQENNEITEEFQIKLLDYINATYLKTDLSFTEYKDDLCKKILFSKNGKITENDIPDYEKDKSIDEIFAELNELVGLQSVKKVLHDLVDLIELKNKTKDDLKIKDTNLHMVFLGNPGTGKTTVARIISEILYNLKYIKSNKLIEVSSKDLVAEYVGQTAPKTNAVIQKALGGVLFIDEAYSLASGNGQGNSYNEEAIATLIQGMENYRDNLVVIFAGYTKEMQDFLNANSGIVSRIGYTLEFADYTEKELLQIFENMMSKSGFDVSKEASEEVLKIIKEYKDTKNFGNARFVRSVYEKTIIKHASNTKGKKAKKILKTITKEDISVENLLKM